MTTLTPMLQFIQDKILLAVHPGCSIEEARMEEVKNKGCILELKTYYKKSKRWITSIGEVVNKKRFMCFKSRDKETIGIRDTSFNWDIVKKIIGLPPTLGRVLNCFVVNNIYHTLDYYNTGEKNEIHIVTRLKSGLIEYELERNYIKKDGTDATLFDQSEETQNAIALLLGWKDET